MNVQSGISVRRAKEAIFLASPASMRPFFSATRARKRARKNGPRAFSAPSLSISTLSQREPAVVLPVILAGKYTAGFCAPSRWWNWNRLVLTPPIKGKDAGRRFSKRV